MADSLDLLSRGQLVARWADGRSWNTSVEALHALLAHRREKTGRNHVKREGDAEQAITLLSTLGKRVLVPESRVSAARQLVQSYSQLEILSRGDHTMEHEMDDEAEAGNVAGDARRRVLCESKVRG